jgi:hypothetical protein
MTSASQLIHVHLGAPGVPLCGPASGICWVCGATLARAMQRKNWQGATFTGQNRARCPESDLVCEACCWATAGKPPDTLRMYSNLLEVGGEHLKLNKGDKPAMRAFLRRRHDAPWFAGIADSGKKHVVPWAPVNPPGARGRVLFEDTIIALPRDDAGWAIVDDAAALATAGATKEEISTGAYGARAWSLCGDMLRTFEARWSRERGGAWMQLAVWLAQRDEAAVEIRMADEKAAKSAAKEATRGVQRRAAKEDRDLDGGVSARGARRVPARGGKPAEALRSDPGEDPRGGAEHVDGGAVDDARARGPATGPAEQLGLPGFA